MKYIKTYENNINNYEIDDYVLSAFSRTTGLGSENEEIKGRIILIDNSQVPFLILLVDGETFWISDKRIKRKLTPKEIEEFEIELSANKYNI